VGWVNLLATLFGRVLIPTTVAQELLQHHGATPSCCDVRGVGDSERLRRLRTQADAGEAEDLPGGGCRR
jgi:predicted nucleic acid-binding protein